MDFRYPKDNWENIKFRWQLIELGERDPVMAKTIREVAARDVLFFFNCFLWAEDPEAEKGLRHIEWNRRLRPIITYPFQDDFILKIQGAIDGGEDLVADKARDMLATYMVLGVFFHNWVYRGRKFLVTSWKEEEIDGRGDISTHFGKLRLFMKMLPKWMRPRDFRMDKHITYMRMVNPETDGTIVGSAASASLGSGRRDDAIFFDEFSKWEDNAKEAWISASFATKSKIAVWTPRGTGNFAYELISGDEVKHKIHLDWYLHPEKCYTSDEHLEKQVKAGKIYDKVRGYRVQLHEDQSKAPKGCYVDQNGRIRSEWYDRECESKIAEDIAENLDRDYTTSGRPVFDTIICEKRKYESRPPIKVGELVWRVRPIFDRHTGECRNLNELAVEFVENVNGDVRIWEEPIDGWEDGYVCGADPAEGLKQGDYNVAVMRRRFPAPGEALDDFRVRTVAEIHSHQKTFEFADDLVKFCIYYNNAVLAIERNNHGLAVINEVFKLYRNLYHDDYLRRAYPEKRDTIGFTTSNQYVKAIVVKELSKAISEGAFIDPREEFWQECLTFVNNDGKMEAQGKSRGQKCFDDRVASMWIVHWVDSQIHPPRRVEREREEKRWLRDKQRSQQSYVGWVV